MDKPKPHRCPSRVPTTLCGGLKGTDRPRCTRDMLDDGRPHTGKCRAQRGLVGVGKTKWEWNASAAESVVPRAAVKLKREPIHQRLAREAACRCDPDGLRHIAECDFAGLIMSSARK